MHATTAPRSLFTASVRPTLAYITAATIACFVLTAVSYRVTGGPFLLFPGEPQPGLVAFTWQALQLTFVLGIAAALPVAMGINLMKSFNVPRLFGDMVQGAIIPVGLVALLASADTVWFEGTALSTLAIETAAAGALAGVIYWLAAGRPGGRVR